MWFDLVLDVLAATILIPIIIGAVVTHGERRKRIGPQREPPNERSRGGDPPSRPPARCAKSHSGIFNVMTITCST
jgi:hypothetical protein